MFLCCLHPQAVISQWDTFVELQRASLPGRHKGNVLLEQEKQRTLALQREELASFHKLQSQHRQEQQRWERERERHRQQVEATEARLRHREEECRRQEVKCPPVLPVGQTLTTKDVFRRDFTNLELFFLKEFIVRLTICA